MVSKSFFSFILEFTDRVCVSWTKIHGGLFIDVAHIFALFLFSSFPLSSFLFLPVIRSALHAVCAIESMSTSSESRVFNEYKEQWMKRDEVRNMWHTIRSEAAGNSRGGGGRSVVDEGKSNHK